MRQTTLDEQTSELGKLGFEFPKELVKTKYDFKTDTYVDTYAYNIGQLLNILPNVIPIDDGYSLNMFALNWCMERSENSWQSKFIKKAPDWVLFSYLVK